MLLEKKKKVRKSIPPSFFTPRVEEILGNLLFPSMAFAQDFKKSRLWENHELGIEELQQVTVYDSQLYVHTSGISSKPKAESWLVL